MMSQDTIDRYQLLGDIWQSLANDYGADAANTVADAALTGDATQVNAALVKIKFGESLNTSTLDIFTNQLANDPLGAPLNSLNNGIGTIVNSATKGIFSNGYVLLAVIIGGLFLFLSLKKKA